VKSLKMIAYVLVGLVIAACVLIFILFHESNPPVNPRDSFNLNEAQRAQSAQAALKGDWKAATGLGMYWFMYRNKPGCGYAWFALAERNGGPSGSNSALEHTRKISNGVPELDNCGPR
jgi:hypothetical protein